MNYVKALRILEVFRNWIKQPSTQNGLILIASAFGLAIAPEYFNAIIVGAGLVLGLVNAIRNVEGYAAEELKKDATVIDLSDDKNQALRDALDKLAEKAARKKEQTRG